MNNGDKSVIKQKILDLITQSQDAIKDMKNMTAPVSPENSIGRISRMDAINNKSVMEAALRHKKEKLSKLKMALSNLDKPEFGICSRCKNPIQPGRLIYMPESTLCIRCADRG
jgi:DnaK suppressor protein